LGGQVRRRLEGCFRLSDQITERVVGIVEPSLRRSEIERSRRKRPESLDAYDVYLRASSHLTSISLAEAPIAAEFLQEALKLDPNYAVAHAYLAWCCQIRFHHGGAFDEADRIAGLQHGRLAIAEDVNDARALAVAAMAINHLGADLDASLHAIERALAFNPSSAVAHYFGAQLYAWGGDSVAAAAYAQRALRLSPFDLEAYGAYLALGIAALHEGRYDEAAAWYAKSAQANPRFGTLTLGHAVMLALAGRMEEARQVCARGLELEPTFRIRVIREIGFAPAITDKIVHALRLLGLPE
jgi:adenylate cyclase